MKLERFRWLAGLIAAHPDRELVGRTRLQKEVWLLQRVGMPSGYEFKMHYYGPYSEGIQADINLLERFKLVKESLKSSQDVGYYSIFTASENAALSEIEAYRQQINRLATEQDVTVLELAATYDMFRKAGLSHNTAITLLRAKKGDKCDGGRTEEALAILGEFGLPSS